LPLHAVINLDDALRRLLFVLAVLYQKSSYGRTQRRLPRLQRELDLCPRIFFPALAGQRKDAVHRIPELRQRRA